jgi:DNA sulfur modification protein DndD
MKIDKVSISNYGIISHINLDISKKEGSLVFLNGRNGRGKSTFQSALKWCFYGDEPPLSKFLSTYALEKAKPGEVLTASVIAELKMDVEGSSAVIERTQTFQKTESGDTKRIGQSQIIVKTRSSDAGSLTDVKTADDSEKWLQTYFPKRLINFFLFDGEMMTNFFELKVKADVENAVREIAGVDRFEKISLNMFEVEKILNRQISKLTGPQAEKLNKEHEYQTQVVADLHFQFKGIDETLKTKKEERDEITNKLSNREEIASAAQKLKDLDADDDSLNFQIQRADEEFQSEILKNGTVSMIAECFPDFKVQLGKAKKEDWLPPPFEPQRIRELITNKICICGTHFREGDEKEQSLTKIIEKHQVSGEIGKVLDKMSRQIDVVESNLFTNWRLIREKNDSIIHRKKLIEANKVKREKLLDIIQDNDATELHSLVEKRKVLDREIDNLSTQKGILFGRSEEQINKLEVLKKNLDEANKGNDKSEILQKEARIAREIAEAANNIHSIAIEQVRERLEKSFNDKFSVVKKGFHTKITQEFEVITLDEFGKETELSEGQKMMKAYIFSICLREVINLGFPLVVDTPFGRLDSLNRAELAKMLSNFLEVEVSKSNRQAFFLMQDTEYNPYTRKYFEHLKPIEAYLAKDKQFENIKSDLGIGIDEDWFLFESWKDWKEGKIK